MSVLSESDIPKELWSSDMLHMPGCLCTSYANLLHECGLMEAACSTEDVKGAIGGRSREESMKHFCTRYGVSTCRVQSLVLDPHRALGIVPDDLLTSLSSGRVTILDIPCGAGAVGAGLLATVAALREHSVLPKLPLDVVIVGGDCSNTATGLYERMIAALCPTLKAVGVNATLSTAIWDGTKSDDTARLMDKWFQNSAGFDEHLVIVANFSGEAGKRFASFERSLQHVHERLYDRKCTMVWVEPDMPGAKDFFEAIRKRLPSWVAPKAIPNGALGHSYKWWHPFQKRQLPCKVLVFRYVRC